ncbi:hypothetical protein C731_1871 [Mycolicibacterium hassiacum DSM 44199]|jgi:hypothetical protein|uniref:Uncharacterized protein n=1 Tax=Mycolicibacterium hassiacum (strain DSM 44199 / CIP 105218 / JCM 12690 / 3849) TaxID=1122247 RepID=K5BGK9_MYCHD|nr:hypothetical protein [Mycolicibacterium hassiacum]EKF24111.1 hypothetical protein C731_1871 [Mycolicibacterium hassiacum DSM 44199]MBX5486937.1 hypothetical protein [Mycolicibacterium hassiacum]MDA4085139.1 hypothetical protein [Mycolicibacterium hassiacum DSM 44199]PZN18342.1 MAG: hypothetical protein DIU75_17255 [Mycolicibacterium hassiacum]VCT90650.1 hypothetical protein MHAS_02359 [Mycolicibacterium hassiacum DSM 44199]
MTESLRVRERGRVLTFTFDDLVRYHGFGALGGLAVAFKAMLRAFGALSPGEPVSRRAVRVWTPFRGPGARDGFEAVTRAVTDGRYHVDRSLVRTDRGPLLEDFMFRVGVEDRAVTVLLRDGFVTAEFIELARTEDRTDEQERRLDALKEQLAERVLAAPTPEVFDLD